MTIVTTITSSGPYTAVAQTTFAVTFQSDSTGGIAVYRNNILVPTNEYTFTRNADGTGSVVFTSPQTATIEIKSSPVFTQGIEFERHGAWYPDQINPGLDNSAVRDLYLRGEVSRVEGQISLITNTTLLQSTIDAGVAAIAAALGSTPTADGGTSSPQVANGLVSGGQVAWQSAYTFRVSAAVYYINGVRYTSSEQTITLDAAHATLDRYDIIALDTTGTVVKITGTAAASPSAPDVDPVTRLALLTVFVDAASTEPEDPVTGVTITASVENVYLEDTEWTTTGTGGGWTDASTTAPFEGTKHIAAASVPSGGSMRLARPAGGMSLEPYKQLNLFVRPVSWPTTCSLIVEFFRNGMPVGSWVTLANGYWGFNRATLAYQFVGIPLEHFKIPPGETVDELVFLLMGGSASFYLDKIQLEPRVSGNSTHTILDHILVAASDETTAITTGTAKRTFRMPYAATLTGVRASFTTAPTGSTAIIDINKNGASILSTKLSVDATEKTSMTAATPPVISSSALANDDEITIDFDQVGSTVAGAGVKVLMIVRRAGK